MVDATHELLAPVLASPHEIAPRRAYAGGVRASDPDRAALIDHQLAIRLARRAGLTPSETDESAARALIRAFGERWSGPIPQIAGGYQYRGGFVEHLRVSGADLAGVATVMRDVAPVRMLTVTRLRGHLDALLGESRFAQLVALDVGENGLADADVEAIAAAPALRGLVALRIAGNVDCGYAALRALARLPALRFVDADDTRTPLRIRTFDAVDGRSELRHTAAQERMETELGALPWIEALERPSDHAL